MAIGKRIRQIRKMRGLTQREVGERAGFNKKSADIRITQYESGTRTPQGKIVDAIALALDVEPMCIDIPDIDSYYGLMHTLFYLEDVYGIRVEDCNGHPCIKFEHNIKNSLTSNARRWLKEYKKLQNGDITLAEYNEWRYTFPAVEAKRSKLRLDKHSKEVNLTEMNGD